MRGQEKTLLVWCQLLANFQWTQEEIQTLNFTLPIFWPPCVSSPHHTGDTVFSLTALQIGASRGNLWRCTGAMVQFPSREGPREAIEGRGESSNQETSATLKDLICSEFSTILYVKSFKHSLRSMWGSWESYVYISTKKLSKYLEYTQSLGFEVFLILDLQCQKSWQILPDITRYN